jgi:dTDP-4-dehydrorhamnose reductase
LHEDDPLAPVNRYGQSKARGEGLVLDSGANALVARVQWLFGGDKSDFVRFVRGRLLSGQEVPVVQDQVGVPSYTMDLVSQLAVAWRAEFTGILNLGNEGEVSREGQAQQIANDLGCTGLFRSVTWLELGRSAARPRRSVLDTTRIRDLVAASAPENAAVFAPWHEAQRRYLKRIEQETNYDDT